MVLARLFFGCQEYDRALDLLDDSLQLNTESQGYSFVLYYQAMAIKGKREEDQHHVSYTRATTNITV